MAQENAVLFLEHTRNTNFIYNIITVAPKVCDNTRLLLPGCPS
jgi:hypothetical protein